jgi:DDE family transposase
MFNVAILAPILQALMTTEADELARQTRFVQRHRGLTGADFLQALTFGYLKRRRAPLEGLAQPLGVSRQALDQRLGKPSAPEFFKAALLAAVGHVLDARPAPCPLLAGFEGVYLDDCTQAWLPDDAAAHFPGTGGSSTDCAKARMKVLIRWEILKGNVCHLGIHPGRCSDHDAEALAPPVPAGGLHVADLGFCDFERLQAESGRGIFWITRLPAQTRFYPKEGPDVPLTQQLEAWRRQGLKLIDEECVVGDKHPVAGRLVCLACPADVVARRLAQLEKGARHRGRPVSARQRETCRWTVLFSNVPAGRLGAAQVWQAYRLRWQIELLFKRFKSEGGLGQTSSTKRSRVESEWYVKLLGQLIRNWAQLLRGGPLCDVNFAQLGRVLADNLERLAEALREGRGLERALARLQAELLKVRARTARQKRKTAARTFAQHPDEFDLVA